MAQFTVPKFIEREPKIIGFLTFRQFAYIGTAGAICFVFYFSVGEKNFLLFLLVTIILMLIAFALAFLKIEGRTLPIVLVNFFKFNISPKIYLWKRKQVLLRTIKKKLKKEEEIEEGLPLKIAEKSKLKKLSTKVETRIR